MASGWYKTCCLWKNKISLEYPITRGLGSRGIQKASWFYFGNNLCTYQDCHKADWPWRADLLSKIVFILGDLYANTTPYTHKNVFTWSRDISLGPCQFFSSLSREIPEAQWFYFGNNLCTCQDSHKAVWPWKADILSKSVFILDDIYANTTPYTRKHVFTWSRDISFGPCQIFSSLSREITQASCFYFGNNCAHARILIKLLGLGGQTYCQKLSSY